MPLSYWSQDVFSKGELSPLMYSRVTVQAYYNGLKTATNCITYPQGAIGKRFGTLFDATVSDVTQYEDIYFQSFQYLNQCTYLLVFVPNLIKIYLEGILVATVTGTNILSGEVRNIDSTVINDRFRVTADIDSFKPKDVIRSSNAANPISGFGSDYITLTNAETAGLIVPTIFTTGTSLPTTVPQVRTNTIYFLYMDTANNAEIYTTAEEARARENKYTVSSAGVAANAVIQNTWAFTDVEFKNYPVFDFLEPDAYTTINFTPAATSGYGVNLTASAPIFSPAYVGGAFFGNGGIARIKSYTSTTVVVIDILSDFKDATAIPGSDVLLAEPAWSDNRGWPTKCSSFQNRSVFANSRSLPNGLWCSVTNYYNDFDGLEEDDDNAISWYPSSDNVNYIRFIVPYRSLTVHTNTGIFSTPLSFESAITPNNFSMTLQDSTPATAIQPRGIDNQIIIMSGNDVHSMLWDGFNNSYTSNIASIASEHLINEPHDEAPYVDLTRAGSRYLFIVNGDGSLVVYQTLISEDVSGFTKAVLEQSYGNAYFRWVTSSPSGRAWFLTERELTVAGLPYGVTEYTTNTLSVGLPFLYLDASLFYLLSGDNLDLLQSDEVFEVGDPTPFVFTTTGSLPTSLPQVELGTFYWAVGTEDLDFYVYLNYEDALAGINNIIFYDQGVDTYVTPQELQTTFMIEELSFDVFTDCTYRYSGFPEDTFTNLARFNGQFVKIDGDGFGFEYTGYDDTVKTIAHGQLVEVESASIGFPIRTVIEPLQVAPPGQLGYKGSSLVFPQHIRFATFMFNNTIGGEINGTPIQFKTVEETVPGDPPSYNNGTFEMSFMLGWNQIDRDGISIVHDEPFDIRLIGIFYKIES